MTNIASLCQMLGGLEERTIQYDETALEGHSYIATKEEESRNEKPWKLPLSAEGKQGPLNQRSDLKQAKQTCKRLYQEHTAITGSGNKLMLVSTGSDPAAARSVDTTPHTSFSSVFSARVS